VEIFEIEEKKFVIFVFKIYKNGLCIKNLLSSLLFLSLTIIILICFIGKTVEMKNSYHHSIASLYSIKVMM